MEAQLMQVRRRRFAYRIGNTFVGVWELAPLDPVLRLAPYQKISFVLARPDEVERKWLRERILQHIEKSREQSARGENHT